MEEEKIKYIFLKQAVEYCSYSQDYLKLRARQGKLKAVKIGRDWATTKEWLEEYSHNHNSQKTKRFNNNNFNNTERTISFHPKKGEDLENRIAKLGQEVRALKLSLVFGLVCVLLSGAIVFGKDSLPYVGREIFTKASDNISLARISLADFGSSLKTTKNNIKFDTAGAVSDTLQTAALNTSFGLASATDVFQEYCQWLNGSVRHQISNIKNIPRNVFLTLEQVPKTVLKKLSDGSYFAFKTLDNVFSTIAEKTLSTKEKLGKRIVQPFQRGWQFVTSPWKISPPGIVVEDGISTEEIEELRAEVEKLKKEPKIIQQVEKITKIEPIKEITKEKIITKVDEKALAVLRTQIAGQITELEGEIAKRLYAPGGVISQTIYVTEPVRSPKIYQENGEIVLQTIGTGNVILSAATGLQLYGQQVIIDSSSILNPLIYLNDNTRITGSITAQAAIFSGDLSAAAATFSSDITGSGSLVLTENITAQNITASGDISIAGNLTVGGAEEYSGAVDFTASSTKAALTGTQTGSGPIFLATSTSKMTSYAVKITNLGSGNSFVVEDADTDSTPFVIDADGNVGVATSTPSAKFAVHGDIMGSGNIVLYGEATSTIAWGLQPAADADSRYFLGSPSYRWANIYAATTTIGGTIVIDSDDIRASGALTVKAANGMTVTSTDLMFSASQGGISATSSDYIALATAGVERMRILSGGNVGIKTAVPQYDLHVLGKCVTGDTELITEDGRKLRVDQVQGGERIYSLNQKTGTLVPEKILALMDMGIKPIYKLETEDGKTIRTTGNHPYLTQQGWQKVVNLKPGDAIAVANLFSLGAMPQSGENPNSNGKHNDCSHDIESSHGFNHDNLFSLMNINPNIQTLTERINPDNTSSGLNSIIKNGITIDAKNTCPISANISETNFNWDWDNIVISFNNNKIKSDVKWEKIISIDYVGFEQVYDLSIENTHNFVANNIIAHNTYISESLSVAGAVTTTDILIDFAGVGNITAASGSTWKTTSGNLTITAEDGTLFATGTDIRLVSANGGIYATSTTNIEFAYSTQFRIVTSSDSDILKIDDEGSVFLSKAMYQPIYGSDDGLVLYLPFSEGHTSSTATTAYDRSPYGNDGTLMYMATSTLSPWCTSTDSTSTPKFGTALHFDGVDDYVNISSPSFSVDQQGTVEFWFNINVYTSDDSFVSFSKPSSGIVDEWRIAMTPNNSIRRVAFLNGVEQTTVLSANNIYTSGVWNHFVMTVDASQSRMFGNGVEFTVTGGTDITWFGDCITDADIFQIGGILRSDSLVGEFNGTIDEVKIYNRALSSEEIKAHYLRGTGAHGVVLADKFRVIDTNNDVNFYVGSDGNVGIGTASPGTLDSAVLSGSGRTFLSVHDSDNIAFLTLSTGAAISDDTGLGRILFGAPNEASGHGIHAMIEAEADGTTAGQEGGRLTFNTKIDGVAGIDERVRIDNAGNVGIGTTGPNSRLEISGTLASPAKVYINNTGGYWADEDEIGRYAFYTTDTSDIGVRELAGIRGVSGQEGTTMAGELAFYTSPYNTVQAEAVRIDKNGNVGIGQTNPLVKLDVEGTAECDGAGCWAEESDIAYKENIRDLDYGLNEILAIQPRRYSLKETSEESIGMIAQELENIIPEIVRGEEGSKSIGYSGLVPVLVNAIQELDSRTKEIREKLTVQQDSNGQIVQIDIASELASLGLIVNETGVLEVDTLKTRKLCVGSVCVTEAEFQSVFGFGSECESALDSDVCEHGTNRACSTEVGACQIGVEVCQNNVWQACLGAIFPSPEICDQVDNDCDGEVDEDGVCDTSNTPYSPLISSNASSTPTTTESIIAASATTTTATTTTDN